MLIISFWFEYLSSKGYFQNPPTAEGATKSRYSIPRWPPIDYLVRISDNHSDTVIPEILKLKSTENVWVLEGIMRIILRANSIQSIQTLHPFINSFIENYKGGYELIIELLKKPFIFDSNLSEITPALLLKLVEFQQDSHEQEKKSRRQRRSRGLGHILDSKTAF